MLRANRTFPIWFVFCTLLGQCALASGPRWVTGPPYFTGTPGLPVQWYTRTPLYFTDPGDLSQYVNHAAADAMVAAAANVWNVPTAMFEIAQGGTLSEHVSSANTSVGSSGLVFPADVQSSNYVAEQIAVIYDSDGSVTDLLLGDGASSTLECPQNGVTESVDSITSDGYIRHAVLVINGLCSGPASAQQLQLQYQLQRAFGRIFGLGWSQTNDNVFTQNPTPSLQQANYWPIMHPIDIVCGQYTYQCLPNPFTLRDDDVASITQLYLEGLSNQFGWTGYSYGIPGKTQSYDRAAHAYGNLNFSSGQGMQGVNLVLQREEMFYGVAETWYDVSTVSGYLFQQHASNPVTGAPSGLALSMGTADTGAEGYFDFAWIPMIDSSEGWVDITVTAEAINPLYTGSHAVGPYTATTVSPNGSTTTMSATGLYPNDAGYFATDVSFTMNQSDTGCPVEADGTETAPAAMPSTGFFSGAICGRGHSSWFSVTVRPGRSATAEVTALDETGAATETKARPLLGAWNSSDATGTEPTVGSTVSPFNTISAGTTALTLSGSSSGFRIAVADDRGDGRPDFAYNLRVLYADAVAPATVPTGGGPVTITGTGFRSGNEVFINGVAATVTSWSANSITAIAPATSAFSRTPSAAVSVVVLDTATGGSTAISSALTYTSATGYLLNLVSAPSGNLTAGIASATPFAVRVVLADGVTPVTGVPVLFTASPAAVLFTGCSGSPCTALTDATGLASVSVNPQAYGAITIQAAAVGATQIASFNAVARSVTFPSAAQYIAAGINVSWATTATLLQNGAPAAGVAVEWTGSSGLSFSPADTLSSAAGTAGITATSSPLTVSAQASATACGWTGTVSGPVCASFQVIPVAMSDWRLTVDSGAGQAIGLSSTFNAITATVTDTAGHPVAGVPVSIYQAIDQLQMACPALGACPIPAPLQTSQTTVVSDANGNVSFQPIQIPGVAGVTQIVLSSGTQGFVSLSITQGS